MSGAIVSWNKGAERMYGYSPSEAIGQPISMLSPSQSPDEIRPILQKVERDEHIEPYETVRRRKDGTMVEISLAISPVRDAHGRIIAASAISRDITEQRRTEAALVEANDKLKAWLNQLERETHEITLLNQMSHLLQTASAATTASAWSSVYLPKSSFRAIPEPCACATLRRNWSKPSPCGAPTLRPSRCSTAGIAGRCGTGRSTRSPIPAWTSSARIGTTSRGRPIRCACR